MTHKIIAIVGAGAMGSAVARRLTGNGWTVLTDMSGRSQSSVDRAEQAGMIVVPVGELCRARLVLSIVPPDVAADVAAELAPILGAADTPPVYVDCNAIRPELAETIAGTMNAAGVGFVDASIIGRIPTDDYAGPTFYVSGPRAGDAMVLNQAAILTKNLGDKVGAASAIKMSYGAITKGHIALGAAMILAARRAGVGEALLEEMSLSQPGFLYGYTRSIPDMFSKSRRWVPEMQEIAAFLGPDRAEKDIWLAIARFYTQMADDYDGEQNDIIALTDSLNLAKSRLAPR